MRKEIFASIAIVGVVAAVAVFATTFDPRVLTLNAMDEEYAQFIAKYGKSYATKEEYLYRRQLYSQALNAVLTSNSQNGATYLLGINKFADMSDAEKAKYLGDLGTPETSESTITVRGTTNADPVDWRDKGVVNAVKDQGSCGGCWAFSTIGPTEEHYAIKYGTLPKLSEQQLIDCSGSFGNSGCNGGLFKYGYQYLASKGSEASSDYPYVAVDQTCAYDSSKVAVKITGSVSVGQDGESLKAALANGPVSISLYASSNSFYYYTSGILNDESCPTQPNHAVHTVGWGTENGQDYFIVRNSWGASWGEKGYIRMATKNSKSTLGICGMFYRVPMYPTIA